jgi:hypothetical protein
LAPAAALAQGPEAPPDTVGVWSVSGDGA